MIDNRLNEIYPIIQNNSQITEQYVKEIIESVGESLNQVDQFI